MLWYDLERRLGRGEERNEEGGGGGTTRSRGIELRGRSSAALVSSVTLSGQELSALGLLSPETRPCSTMLLMAYLSKPLSIELFNMTRYAEGNYLSLL